MELLSIIIKNSYKHGMSPYSRVRHLSRTPADKLTLRNLYEPLDDLDDLPDEGNGETASTN